MLINRNMLGAGGFDQAAPGSDMSALALFGPDGLIRAVSFRDDKGLQEALAQLAAIGRLRHRGLGVRWNRRGVA